RARGNGDYEDVGESQHRNAQATDPVGRFVDAEEALVDRIRGWQTIDQNHGAGAFTAKVPADRRSLPEHAQVPGILGVERAFAEAQATDECAATFLAEDITVGQA